MVPVHVIVYYCSRYQYCAGTLCSDAVAAVKDRTAQHKDTP